MSNIQNNQEDIISITDVCKNYGEFSALKGVSFNVKKGSTYGIIGLSGAGKTSLIRIMSMLERPSSGKVIIHGKDIFALQKKDLKDFRKDVGMIFQHFNLLSSRTVFGNVAFALECCGEKDKKIIYRKVMQMLELVNLTDKANNYPSQLSGGQKQRVAIARALVNTPSILFSDESTSALDPMTTASILELIKQLQKEFALTVVLITHQIEIVKYMCDRVCILREGLIVEEGVKDDIFENPKDDYTKKIIRHSFFA